MINIRPRKPLRKIGKIGRANIKANQLIAKLWEREGIDYCELAKFIPQVICVGFLPLQNCHRHDRYFYRDKLELLSDRGQVVRGCQNHHTFLDHHPKEKREIFIKLRGVEIIN